MFKRAVSLLCVVVLLFTMNTLKRTANTLERVPMCGFEEHVHDSGCYNSAGELACGMPEHVHTDACYQESPTGKGTLDDLDLRVDGLDGMGDVVDGDGAGNLDLSMDLDQGGLLDFVQSPGNQTATTGNDLQWDEPVVDAAAGSAADNADDGEQGMVVEIEDEPVEAVTETKEEQPAETEAVTETKEEEQPAETESEAETETEEEQPAETEGETETEEEQPAETEAVTETEEEQPAETEGETETEEEQPAETEAVTETKEEEQPAETESETETETEEEQPAETEGETETETEEEQPAETESEAETETEEEQPAETEGEAETETEEEQPTETEAEIETKEEEQSAETEGEAETETEEEQPAETESEAETETEEEQPAETEGETETETKEEQPAETEGETETETEEEQPAEAEGETETEEEQPAESEGETETETEEEQPAESEGETETETEEEQPAESEGETETEEEQPAETEGETETEAGDEASDDAEVAAERRYTATVDLADSGSNPISLREAIANATPAEEYEDAADEAAELPVDEWSVEFDSGLFEIVATEDDVLLTPLAGFESAEVIISNGSRYELTLLNCALEPSEGEAQVEEETEAGDEAEAPVAYPAAHFEQGTDHVNVVVDAPEGAFPEGTTMTVEDVRDEGTIQSITDSVTGGFVEVTSVNAVNISFWHDGVEIEPLLPIAVVMSAVEADAHADTPVVVHVADDGETTVVDSESIGANGASLEMPAAQTFEADTFSIYAIVGTQTLDTKYIDEAGNTWSIRVSYTEEARLPEGATLKVTEVKDESYLAGAQEALESGKRITKARFFDITILDRDGNEVQPKAPVDVIINLVGDEGTVESDEEPTEVGDPSVRAIHFVEEGDGNVKVESQKATETESGVTFAADSFSVWGVVYTVDFEVEGNQGVVTLDFTDFDATTVPGEGAIFYNTEDCNVHIALSLLEKVIRGEAETEFDIGVDADIVNDFRFDFEKAASDKANREVALDNGEIVIGSDGFIELTDGERFLKVEVENLTALKQALLETEGVSIEVIEGNVPVGSEASYTAHTSEETAELVETYINKEENGDVEVAGYCAADLKIVRNDETLPVEGQFQVTVDKASLVPVGMKLDKLYHIHRDENDEAVVEELAFEETEAGLVFEVANFSDIVASYTVDFEYVDEDGNVHTWHFPGTGSYNLRTVLTALDIEYEEISKATLTPVEIVDEETEGGLFLTQNADGEWFINSLAPFDDTYELAIITDVKGYVIKVTDAQGDPYTIEFKFYGADGNPVTPSSFGSNYWYFATDAQTNDNYVTKNYYSTQQLTDLNSNTTKTITITQFSIGNGNPNDHTFQSGEDVSVDFFTSPDGQPQIKNDEGTYTFQSDRHYSVIETGSVAGGFVFEKVVGTDKTTYIGRKQAPYTFNINTTDGAAIDFDSVYGSNWYALSILKKGDGSGTYHYAQPVDLQGKTTFNGTVDTFYANSNPALVSISNPGEQTSTASNVYVTDSGDTVTTVLIHRDSAASSYADLLQLESNGNIVGTMYADGDGMNKYTLSVSDNNGSSALTLKKADLPTVTVKFLDADGVTSKASLLTEDEYYIYVDLNRGRGKNHYGYIEKLDLTQATKDYTIPYFYGINEAGKKDYSTDRAYMTDGCDYTVHIVKRHDSAPTLEMCQKKSGVIMYGNGDLVEETVLNTEGATHISAPYTTSSSELNGLVKFTALPELKVRTQFFNAGTEQTGGATITGKYYLLVCMTKADGSAYYSLVQVDDTKSPSDAVPVEYFTSAGDDGQKYYYTGTENISVAVVQTTDGTLPALYNAINGTACYKYELGALTGDGYKLTGTMNDASKTYTARLEKSDLASDAYKATVTFYNQKNGERLSTLDPQLDANEKYYLLASLNSAADANNKQVVGYAIVEITADQIASANSNGAFEVILPANQAYQMVDATGKEITGQTLTFDASKFSMSARLYHASYVPTTYAEAKGKDDTVDGYDFWENTPASDGKSTTIKLYKSYKKIYKVQVNFSETMTIPSEDPIHIKVEAKHATTGTDVYEADIEVQSENSWTRVIEDQINNTSIWTSLGKEGNTFSGNEEVTITLSRGGKVIAQGGLTHGCTVAYNTPERTEVSDDTAKTTTITDYVTLTKIDTSHDYDYYSILGEGVGYGITADYLYQNGHIQSNFATNYYYGNNIIEPDLAGHGAIIVIADYALKEGKALEIGGSHVDGTQTVIYLGNGGTIDLVRNVQQRDWVHVIPSDTQELTDNMVEPIINHMKQMSAELMTHEITLHPDSKYINLLDFPEDATIYLDGDELKYWVAKGDDGLFITKHKNQMIVFNFDESSDVTIGQYHVQYAPGEDATYCNGNYFATESPTGKGDPKNVFADELAKHVVYNLASVRDVTVDTYVGMILVPLPDSSMNITGTSAGWVISDGYVTNSGAEWHSVYAEMPDSSTTELTIYKTMDHEKRSPGEHQVFNFNLDHLITTGANRSWNRLATRTNDSRTVKFTKISEMEDGWNVYRITEDADNIPVITSGSYRMDERAVYAFVRYFTVNGTVKIAGAPRYYMQATGSETPDFFFDETTFDRTKENLVAALGGATTGVGIKPLNLPTFENFTRRDGLEIQKKVLGTNNPNARFEFEIKIWLETTDPEHAKIFEDAETTKSYKLSGVPGQTTIEFTKMEEDGQTFGRAYLTMPGNQVAFIAGIPVDAHYTVTEIATIADITSDDPLKTGEVPFTENVSNGYTKEADEKTGVIIENDASKAVFTNTYHAEGEYSFEGGKKMLGRDMAADNGFRFVIKQGDVEIATGTVPAGSEGEAQAIAWTPDKLTFDQDDVGEHNYIYTVEELTDNLPEDVGVLGATSYELELNVVDNGDGTLSVTRVKPVENDELVFTNTLKAQQTLEGTKTLIGRDMTAEDRFVFNVTEGEGADAVVVATGEVTGPSNADTPANIAFTPITYLYDGDATHYPKTYTYTITEDESTLDSHTANTTGKNFTATVQVRLGTDANGKQILVADAPVYSDPVAFTNTWEEDKTSIEVSKEWYLRKTDGTVEKQTSGATKTFTLYRTTGTIAANGSGSGSIPIKIEAGATMITTCDSCSVGDKLNVKFLDATSSGGYVKAVDSSNNLLATTGWMQTGTGKITEAVLEVPDNTDHVVAEFYNWDQNNSTARMTITGGTVSSAAGLTHAQIIALGGEAYTGSYKIGNETLTGSFTLNADETKTISGLPKFEAENREYHYYVVETGANDTEYVYAVETEGESTKGVWTVKNYKTDEETGALTITKQVTVNNHATITNVADGSYSFTVTAPDSSTQQATIVITGGQSSSATLTDLTPGVYTITEDAPSGDITFVSATGDGTDSTGVERGVKLTVEAGDVAEVNVATFTNNKDVDDITVLKRVVDGNDSTQPFEPLNQMSEKYMNDSADHDIGDTIIYTVHGTVPEDFADYTSYKYQFEDKMTNLTYVDGSAKVIVHTVDDAVQNNGQTYVITNFTPNWNASTKTLTVDVGTGGDLKTVTSGTVMTNYNRGDDATKYPAVAPAGSEAGTITPNKIAWVELWYQATLDETAQIGSTGNPNEARINHSNNPATDGIGSTTWDKNKVFTYALEINKVDADGQPLNGASFTLEKKYLTGTEWRTVALNNAKTTENKFVWTGIDDGIYRLTETQPDGYLPIAPIEFEVIAGHEHIANDPKLETLALVTTDPACQNYFTDSLTETGVVTSGTIVANIPNVRAVSVPVTKTWSGAVDSDTVKSITYRITRSIDVNGEPVEDSYWNAHYEERNVIIYKGENAPSGFKGKTVPFDPDSANPWNYTWTGLEETGIIRDINTHNILAEGRFIYTVEETAFKYGADSFTVDVNGDTRTVKWEDESGTGWTVTKGDDNAFTNSLEPTTASVSKVWEGPVEDSKMQSVTYELRSGIRGQSNLEQPVEQITVIAEGPAQEGQVVKSDDNWGYNWRNLPKYGKGNALVPSEEESEEVKVWGELEYTVVETGFTYDGVEYVINTDGTVAKVTGVNGEGKPTTEPATYWTMAQSGDSITNTLAPISLNVIKVEKGTSRRLSGAEFQLTRSVKGTYTVFENDLFAINAETNKRTGAFSVGETGEITIRNLLPGDYKLSETKAPSGYIITTGEVEFTINVDGTVTVAGRNADSDGNITYTDTNNMVTFAQKTASASASVTVQNEPGAALPATGGAGTGVVYGAGAALVLLALLGFIMMNRKRSEGDGI